MNIWKELLTALVRSSVQVLVGLLVAHGVITSTQAQHFTGELTLSIVAAVTLFLVTYGASVWNKIKAKNRFIAALASPPNTPPDVVIARADSSPLAVKIATATSPGTIPTPRNED